MKDALQAILNDFGAKIGIDLPLSAEGQVAIGVDDIEIGLTHVEGSDELHLHTILGALPDDPDATFYSVLMSANHMGAMTQGAAIGCDLEEGLVTLNHRIPVDWLTLPRFEALLESFADLAGAWRDNFSALTDAAAQPVPDSPVADGNDWIRM